MRFELFYKGNYLFAVSSYQAALDAIEWYKLLGMEVVAVEIQ